MADKYFYGQKISDYGVEHGKVDYGCLARAINHVLSLTIMNEKAGEWFVVNGSEVDEDDEYYEFFQYYIIDEEGAKLLQDETNETVWYNDEMDMYVWGVTHYGTSWDYVLTDIKIDW